MYCRHCGKELEEDQVLCENCGGDNSLTVVQEKKPVSIPWKVITVGICVAAVLIGLLSAVMLGSGGFMTSEEVTVKASYTGTDEQVLDSLDTVVAVAGEFELTNRELQVAYWTVIYDFVSYYGDYVSYWIDFSQPLDQQYFDSETGVTWQQYFLESAIKTWRRYEMLVDMAQNAGISMSQDLEDYFAELPELMEQTLASYEVETVDQLVQHDFGAGSDYESYEAFMRLYYYGNEYYELLYNSMEVTEQEIETYYANNESDFVSAGYSKEDGNMVDVRHILLAPGADDETWTDEQWADCEVRAQELLNTWLEGTADEDYFAELAMEYSSCSSASQGGLIQSIQVGQMVQEFEDWCMAEHEYGDYGIVRTSYGYHLMFYVSERVIWYEVAKSGALSTKMSELLAAEEEDRKSVV